MAVLWMAVVLVAGCDDPAPAPNVVCEAPSVPPPKVDMAFTCEALCDARDRARELSAKEATLEVEVAALMAEAKRRHLDVAAILDGGAR